MSTRYVWEKYAKKYEEKDTAVSSVETTAGANTVLSASDYTSDENGMFSPKGQTAYFGTGVASWATDCPYFFLNKVSSSTTGGDVYRNMYINKKDSGGIFWRAKVLSNDSSRMSITLTISAVDLTPQKFYSRSFETSQGSLSGYASSTSSSRYPNNAASGSYWYKYLGEDNIDPSSVRYSESELAAGESVTIRVTPITPTYGGTIYYQYQYSTNGGNTWSNSGSRTTATSKSMTVPEGAQSFRARVVASDGWGFTSTTYVYGPSLAVTQLKAYAAVDGKTRALSKGWAVVDGIVREISKGYATVDGKWKKLF